MVKTLYIGVETFFGFQGFISKVETKRCMPNESSNLNEVKVNPHTPVYTSVGGGGSSSTTDPSALFTNQATAQPPISFQVVNKPMASWISIVCTNIAEDFKLNFIKHTEGFN